jgi:hypothetical protein
MFLHLTLSEEVSFTNKKKTKQKIQLLDIIEGFPLVLWLSEEFLLSPEKERSAWFHRGEVSVLGFLAICE